MGECYRSRRWGVLMKGMTKGIIGLGTDKEYQRLCYKVSKLIGFVMERVDRVH